MNKAIQIIPVIAILLSITTSTLTTAVEAHTGNGFDNGYAKGKFDITHGQPLNDTCSPKGKACDQFQSGYVTAVNQYAYHCKLCVPNNATLLKMDETGSTPSRMAYTADGYTDGYNKGRSDTLNNRSFSDLCLSNCDNYKRGYITGWVEMHMATGTPFDWKLLNANTTA
jgi:hypothetical protein